MQVREEVVVEMGRQLETLEEEHQAKLKEVEAKFEVRSRLI